MIGQFNCSVGCRHTNNSQIAFDITVEYGVTATLLNEITEVSYDGSQLTEGVTM